VTDDLRADVWQHCGLFRDGEGLRELTAARHELVKLVATSALTRTESRGCHFRTDYPAEDPALARHVVLRRGFDPVLEVWP
jgi:L-aspartate oxidase